MRRTALATAGLGLGVLLGVGFALFADDGRPVATQADPCFGRGQLLEEWTYTVTAEGAKNAEAWGQEVTPGETREARKCRASPLEVHTIDGPTGTVLRIEETIDYALRYYAQHPDELPINKAKEALQEGFVAIDQVALQQLLVRGCDPAWVQRDLPAQRLRVCFPQDWTVDGSRQNAVLLNLAEERPVGLNIHAPDPQAALDCATPATLDTSFGSVQACAMKPQFGGQSHHLLLPNDVKMFVWVSDAATPEERAAAFQVAASVGALP